MEANTLGTASIANADGMIDGVAAKLYISGSKLMMDVGYTPGTIIRIF
jgi:hypothetical protein